MLARLLPVLLAAALGACVSVSEAPMTANAIQKDQKVVVVVYPSPGPAMTEKSTNMEQVAKIVPGMGFFMSATQNARDLEASNELRSHLPAWKPQELFYPVLLAELASSGNPGRFVPAAEAGLSEQAQDAFNQSKDVTDWLVRYCVANPDDPKPRNYAALPGFKGAVVLEVNLAYGAPADGSGHWIPNLDAVTKLIRADDLSLLWRHEDSVEDDAGMKTPAEFERDPAGLLAKYRALMPRLAQAIGANFKQGLQASGVYAAPSK